MNLKIKIIFFITLALTFTTPLQATDVAKTFYGKTMQGEEVFLEDHKGKVVMVSFWASWCSYCLKEIPILDKILNNVGDDRLAVIAINWKEKRKVFRTLARKNKHSKILFTHDEKGFIGAPYNFKGIPYLMIFNHDGSLSYKHSGYGEKTLMQIIDEVNGLLIQQANAQESLLQNED